MVTIAGQRSLKVAWRSRHIRHEYGLFAYGNIFETLCRVCGSVKTTSMLSFDQVPWCSMLLVAGRSIRESRPWRTRGSRNIYRIPLAV